MITNLATIMAVDDEPANILLLESAFKDKYKFISAPSGVKCLEMIDQHTPDLILMNVKMPSMDGYEACKQLKADFTHQDIPILFLSSNTDLEAKLKGYSSGGEDYITKPYILEEVIAKIDQSLACNNKRKESISNATNMAYAAISNIGELGTVIHFMEASFSCDDYSQLAIEITNALANYNLSCCVQIRGKAPTVNKSSNLPDCSPLELELMELLINKKRIMPFGKRTAFNFNNVSVIIKNMPVDDDALYGRLNDHIASILNGAEARIKNIDVELTQQTLIFSRIKQSIVDIDKAIEKLKDIFDERDLDMANVMHELLHQFQLSFSSLALTEEQEGHMTELLQTNLDRVIEINNIKSRTDKHFSNVCKELYRIITPHETSVISEQKRNSIELMPA